MKSNKIKCIPGFNAILPYVETVETISDADEILTTNFVFEWIIVSDVKTAADLNFALNLRYTTSMSVRNRCYWIALTNSDQ